MLGAPRTERSSQPLARMAGTVSGDLLARSAPIFLLIDKILRAQGAESIEVCMPMG